MQLKKLDRTFYNNNNHLKQALDNTNGNWEAGKVRGYGVVVINFNGLTFAIPLRSNIKHKAAFITVKNQASGNNGKGLDFTKALLITDSKYISASSFKISPDEYKKLLNKEVFITDRFERYVEKYVKARNNSDRYILNSTEYRFTTLINYHSELGLNSQG